MKMHNIGRPIENRKHNTVFFLLARPILIVLLVFIIAYTLLMHRNVLSYLKTNAVTVFNEQVAGRRLSVSNEMINHWSKIQGNAEEIIARIEQITAQRGAALTDIQTDAALNQQILDGLKEDIIGTLRTCGTTEIFVVLDGNAVVAGEKDNVKAGVYLRNSNPDFYSNDNQDLLFERGVPALSKSWKISLDSYWSAGFDFSDKEYEDHFCFTKPFQAACDSESKDFENFAYWGYGYPINNLDKGVLSYSIPLIASDGSVIGVMGVGINAEYFSNFINYRELAEGHSGACFLARTTDGVHFEPVIFNGPAYNKNSFLNHEVVIREEGRDSLLYLYLEGEDESSTCASVEYLQLYDSNTPFEGERWALVGLQPESQLMAAYNGAQMMLILLDLSGILIGFISVFWTSRLVSRPLRRLMEDLRGSDSHKPIHLERLKVEEIDELINAIESLSARVAASSSKISTIIQMAESGIGVFEYLKEPGLVFCSRSLYEICLWEPVIDTNEYIDSTIFSRRMSELVKNHVQGEKNLYEISMGEHGSRWLRLNVVEDSESIIGVLTDVTSAVYEKRQIEYERNYDTLTSLSNLRAFDEKVQFLSGQHPEELKTGALVMWDMDNLKFVNDAYGHHVGDSYIIALADCLRRYQDDQVLSARRSGDEFYTLFYGFENKEQISEILRNIWEDVQQSGIHLPDGSYFKLRVSAGVSWYPENSRDFSQLYQYSDFAMYTVKHSQKGAIRNFDPAAYHEDWYLTQGQGDFNTLLDNRLVRYAVQPIVAVTDGSVYGYEMLMRSEMQSFQSPMDILRMAHAQSRLYEIEVMTWFESLKTFAQLVEYGVLEKGSRVFINSIASQILREDAQRLLEQSYACYLPDVVCEFTEEEHGSARITEEKLQLMRRWKSQVALDDYGCGYNSEAVLLELDPDIIKVDMEIVRGIDRDENRQHLVENLVLYAHKRGMLVLGEGVETSMELETLIHLGIDLVQGYYIARPSFEGTPPSDAVCRETAAYYRSRNSERKV